MSHLDRLSRSLTDLISLVERLGKRGVQLRSLKENIDTTTSNGKLLFHLTGVLAEYEREKIRERTLEGLEAARTEGRVGGRPRVLKEKQERLVLRMRKDGESLREIASTLNVSIGTIRRTLERLT